MKLSWDSNKKENVRDDDWQAPSWVDVTRETAQHGVNALLEPLEINIAGVRMNALDTIPTNKEIEDLGLVIVPDRKETRPDSIAFRTITDSREFVLRFPHITEAEAIKWGLLPYVYCVMTPSASQKVHKNRGERWLNRDEWEKLMAYARENRNDALIKAMNTWYMDCRYDFDRRFGMDMWNYNNNYMEGKDRSSFIDTFQTDLWGCFMLFDELSNGTSYVWFDHSDKSKIYNSINPYHMMVARAVSIKNNSTPEKPLASSKKSI